MTNGQMSRSRVLPKREANLLVVESGILQMSAQSDGERDPDLISCCGLLKGHRHLNR